jgi:hypothetical protein
MKNNLFSHNFSTNWPTCLNVLQQFCFSPLSVKINVCIHAHIYIYIYINNICVHNI